MNTTKVTDTNSLPPIKKYILSFYMINFSKLKIQMLLAILHSDTPNVNYSYTITTVQVAQYPQITH